MGILLTETEAEDLVESQPDNTILTVVPVEPMQRVNTACGVYLKRGGLWYSVNPAHAPHKGFQASGVSPILTYENGTYFHWSFS